MANDEHYDASEHHLIIKRDGLRWQRHVDAVVRALNIIGAGLAIASLPLWVSLVMDWIGAW